MFTIAITFHSSKYYCIFILFISYLTQIRQLLENPYNCGIGRRHLINIMRNYILLKSNQRKMVLCTLHIHWTKLNNNYEPNSRLRTPQCDRSQCNKTNST